MTVGLRIPRVPAGPKAVVVGPLPDPEPVLAAGAIVVTYRFNWQRLAALKPPPPPPSEPPKPPQKMYGAWLLASPTPKTIGKGYFELIHNDIDRTVPRVIDYLLTLPEVDAARIGLSGISTNGFTALGAAADPRVSAATVLVACGEYHSFLHYSSLAMNGAPLDLDPAYDAWLRRVEPVAHPERLVHAAILMVNGSDDTAVPARCAEETAHVLRRAAGIAGVPEHFRFVLLPGASHNLGPEAMHEVMAWWYRWLLTTTPAS